MSIDEPWHDDGVAGVDLLGVASPEARPYFGDAFAFDQDIGLQEIWSSRSQGENAATFEQKL
jgi:hypothetical protein